jgi:hypothetical protein
MSATARPYLFPRQGQGTGARQRQAPMARAADEARPAATALIPRQLRTRETRGTPLAPRPFPFCLGANASRTRLDWVDQSVRRHQSPSAAAQTCRPNAREDAREV